MLALRFRNEPDPVVLHARSQPCVAIVMLGFVTAVFFHHWITAYESAEYPAATYLYRPKDTMGVAWEGVSENHCFGDFYAPWIVTNLPCPYVQMPWGQGSNYLPFAHILMIPFSVVPYWAALPVYLLLCTAMFLWFFWRTFVALPFWERLTATVALGLMSYPVQFLLDRGNLESFVFFFLVGFYALYTMNRPYFAATSLAAAVAIKGYPAVLALLFINRQQLRPLMACGIISVVLTGLSASCFRGGALTVLADCMRCMAQYSSSRPDAEAIAGGSSLWGLLTISAHFANGLPVIASALAWCARNYIAVQLVAGLAVMGLFLTVRLRIWEALSVCCFTMMAILPIGPDYRLIHWLIAAAAFFSATSPVPQSVVYSVLFGLLLMPKGLVIFGEIKLSAVINPILMLTIVGMIVASALRRSSSRARPYVALINSAPSCLKAASPRSKQQSLC